MPIFRTIIPKMSLQKDDDLSKVSILFSVTHRPRAGVGALAVARFALAVAVVVEEGPVAAVAETQVLLLELVQETLEALVRPFAPTAGPVALGVAHFSFLSCTTDG